jgi:MoaA/NifB/PqqE/SkfB family radical SAM enzyme
MFTQKGYYTKLIICVNRINYHEFDDIIQLARILQVSEVMVVGLIEFDFNSNLSLSSEERNKIIDKCRFINKNYKNLKIYWATSLGEMNTLSPVVDFCSNMTGFNPFIRANGDCDFCCDAEGAFLGSIKNASLLELAKRHLEFINYMRMDRYKKIMEDRYENMSVCNYCIATYKKFTAEKEIS